MRRKDILPKRHTYIALFFCNPFKTIVCFPFGLSHLFSIVPNGVGVVVFHCNSSPPFLLGMGC